MTAIETIDVARTIDTYFAFLNEMDAARLRQLAAQAWAPDARYVDPHHDGTGRDVLIVMVQEVHAKYPGFSFRRRTGIDAHNDLARYGWEFNAPDGGVVITGVDFASLDADGRLKQVAGFHGDLTAL